MILEFLGETGMIKFSIVVCTAGDAKYLSKCLQSLHHNVDMSTAEVLVVDNNQDDKHHFKLLEMAGEYNFRYVREMSPGLSTARHTGVMNSLGEVISFIDDDVIVSDTWFNALVDVFKNNKVVLAGGPSFPSYEKQPPKWVRSSFQTEFNQGKSCMWLSLLNLCVDIENVNPMLIWGLNFNIRRQILIQLGGFNPDLVPKEYQAYQGDGESALTSKIKLHNLRADYIQNLSVSHMISSNRLKVDYLKARAFYQGVGLSFIRKKNLTLRHTLWIEHVTKVLKIVAALLKFQFCLAYFKFNWLISENRGYRWHSKQYKTSAKIRDWVQIKNYFGEKIPID